MAGIKCPSKVEMADFENSNGSYGEPPPKRSNINQSASRSQGSNNTADANITLWQFLLDLLVKQQYSNIICWTNNEGEFKLLDAEQVAKLWGLKKNKNNMNYDKLSRALRYYYDKNIIKKVIGHKFVYRFVSFPEMVKTENRIPFKKKMESIISESSTSPNSNNNGTVSSAMNGFQTLRPYDVKSGLIQQAQLAAAANMVQQQATLRHHAVTQALLEQKYQLPAEHRALYHADKSPLQTKLSSDILHSQDSRSSTPKMSLQNSSIDCTEISSPSHRQSPQMSPVSVCTPDASPTPPPQFDLPVAGTPTPPPKPVTPVKNKEPEVKVKLEIPELDDNKNCNGNSLTDISSRRTSKHSKSKPDPLSISNDVVVNHSVTSPLMTRSLLPGLNTPMFLTSPMFGQRTPLPLGLPFWGPGTLSPVHTLSPRIPGYGAGPAFQFPAFSSISPATLSSFGNFADTVFNISNMNNSNSDRDKKVSS